MAGAVELCEAGGADLVHFDVMDGHFVPNLTFGIPVLKALAARTSLPIDVHLMVSQPDRLLDAYLEAGAAWVSVHWEAATPLDRTLARIREAGAKAWRRAQPGDAGRTARRHLAQSRFCGPDVGESGIRWSSVPALRALENGAFA